LNWIRDLDRDENWCCPFGSNGYHIVAKVSSLPIRVERGEVPDAAPNGFVPLGVRVDCDKRHRRLFVDR
jgi:hypothetical protein